MPWITLCYHCGYYVMEETRRQSNRSMYLHSLHSHPQKRYWREIPVSWGQLQEYELSKDESLYWWIVRNFRKIIEGETRQTLESLVSAG